MPTPLSLTVCEELCIFDDVSAVYTALLAGRTVRLHVTHFYIADESPAEVLAQLYTIAATAAANIEVFGTPAMTRASTLGVTLSPTAETTMLCRDVYTPQIGTMGGLIDDDDWDAATAAYRAYDAGIQAIVKPHTDIIDQQRMAAAQAAAKDAIADQAKAAKQAADLLQQQQAADLVARYKKHEADAKAGRPTGQRNQGNYHNSRLKRGSISVMRPLPGISKSYYSDDWTGDRFID